MAKKAQVYRRTYIRQWRQFRKLTLERLAEMIEGGMTPSNLSMLERGQRGYTQETLERIARALGTDVASLLTRTPKESEGLWSIWDKAQPAERETIVELAQTIIKRRA